MLNNEEITRARALVGEVRDKALEVNLFYVVVLFRGPITHHIERRFGLFGSSTEASIFYQKLKNTYENAIGVPYWIESDVSYLGTQDHGLLTDTSTDDESFLEDLRNEQKEQM